MSPLDRVVARLRELALANPTALSTGATPELRGELLSAFADDIAFALRDAEAHARELLAKMTDGPGPWAFASAGARARRAAVTEHRDRWHGGLTSSAELARELARLYAAAAPLVDVLAAAEAAAG